MRLSIVLVSPARAENVGAAARAMKTMGFSDMRIVDSEAHLQPAARWVAHGSGDILDNIKTYATLEQALHDVDFTVATTARSRARFHYYATPQQLLPLLEEKAQWMHHAALVFGRERVGLTNEELQKCHYHVAIAANPEYSSLNLAMAVQVIAYEVRMAWLAAQEQNEPVVEHEETPYPLVDDLERFYGHLEQTLLATGFIRASHPGQVMNKLRRLFTRARPESQELNILRGMLASIEQQQKNKES